MRKFTHLLVPFTVSAQPQLARPPHVLARQVLLLTPGSSSAHSPLPIAPAVTTLPYMTKLCAPATPGNRESSPVGPRMAAPASLSALLREMAPLARPLLSSSKSCPSGASSPRARGPGASPSGHRRTSRAPRFALCVTRSSLTMQGADAFLKGVNFEGIRRARGLPGRRSGRKNHRDDMTTTSKLGSLACLPGVLSSLPVSRGCQT